MKYYSEIEMLEQLVANADYENAPAVRVMSGIRDQLCNKLVMNKIEANEFTSKMKITITAALTEDQIDRLVNAYAMVAIGMIGAYFRRGYSMRDVINVAEQLELIIN